MRKPTMDYNASTQAPGMASSHASLQGYSDYHTDQPYHSQSDREGRSSRASSRTQSDLNSEASRYNRARKPINEAVTSAFTAADTNHVAIPPELMSQITSQITANVLQQLKANSIPPPVAEPIIPQPLPKRPTMSTDRTESSSSFTGSPPLDRSKVYTPPSPHRSSEQATQSQTSPTFSNFSMGSTYVPEHTTTKRAISPFSGAGHSDDSDEKEKFTRPDAPRRVSTSGGATILEKIWGKMYDDEGRCTERLGQYLRGIAVHIIEDYEPKNSLVITPDKMLKYYEETKLPNEFYPWNVVFDDRTSSISRMFRDVEVQHHLVQDRVNERPDIPGMTPQGFETWMKLALKAQPDLEFERLALTALHMPISNPDDKQERFPKQISRRLFPKDHDPAVARKLEKVMRSHCGVRLPTRSDSSTESDSKTPQPTSRASVSQATTNLSQKSTLGDDLSNNNTTQAHRSSVSERAAPPPPTVESVIDEDDMETTNSKPIERERKPYVAQPGGGKLHQDADPATLTRVSTVAGDSFSSAPPVKINRSKSVTGSNKTNDTKPKVIPVSLHQRNPQVASVSENRHHRTRSFASNEPRINRNRSPSETRSRDPMHRSDNDIKSSSYQSTGSTDYAPNAYRGDKYVQERYANEHRGSFSVDQRERERDRDRDRDRGRDDRDRTKRYQSIGSADTNRHYYPTPEEEYYRSNAPNTATGGYGGPDGVYYPPTAYRTKN